MAGSVNENDALGEGSMYSPELWTGPKKEGWTPPDCWTCEPIQQYVDLSKAYTTDISAALQTPMLIVFTSCVAFWIVWSGIKLGMGKPSFDVIVSDAFFIFIASILFTVQGPQLIETIYTTALLIMGSAAETALTVAASNTKVSTNYSGMAALAATAEKSVQTVFIIANTIIKSGSALNIVNYVYAIILVVPYFLLIVVYFAQIVIAIFRVMMISTFAPFLFLGFAFGWGRGMAASGVRTLASSIIVLFACTVAVSVTIYGVNALDLQNTKIPIDELASITNARFLVILALGWLGTAFMAEATSIANSITGSMLTNTAAGIITAGAVGSTAAVLAASKGGAGAMNPLTAGGRYGAAIERGAANIEGLQKLGSHIANPSSTITAFMNQFKK